MITVPASITIEFSKIRDKNIICRRAFVRITSMNFVYNLSKLNKEKRMISVKFIYKEDKLCLILTRVKRGGNVLQTYFESHPFLQLVLNKNLPKNIWEESAKLCKTSNTIPVLVCFYLNQWEDISLTPEDFLPPIEFLPKLLMKTSFNYGFKVEHVPKGRGYDLELISPSSKKYIFAISSHDSKNQSRSKEKRKQKILMDIAKMLPFLTSRNIKPIIISTPLEYDGSWSYTSDYYLNFYKEKFNFKFLTTDFEINWADKICKELLILDKESL